MPWWAVAGFTGYSLVLAWHTTYIIENAGVRALWLLPFFLIKLSVLLVALSYWMPPVCHLIANLLNWYAFLIALCFTFREAVANLKIALFDDRIPTNMDNSAIIFTLLATVICPSILLVFAARVLLLHECAKI